MHAFDISKLISMKNFSIQCQKFYDKMCDAIEAHSKFKISQDTIEELTASLQEDARLMGEIIKIMDEYLKYYYEHKVRFEIILQIIQSSEDLESIKKGKNRIIN